MKPTPAQPHDSFVAIDFETADTGRDSACAVALIRVDGDRITQRHTRLIQPPRETFEFTHIHGLRWRDVQGEPTFAQVWPTLEAVLDGAAFLVAHNASFDRGVLNACCREAGLQAPTLPWACTMKLARQAWKLYPTRLPDLCARLDIPLKHHDPTSDADPCATAMIALRAEGWGP